MNDPVIKRSGPLALRADWNDLAALVTGRPGIRCTHLSPFFGGAAPGGAGAAGRLAEDPVFQASAEVLSRPGLRIVFWKGGGGAKAEKFTVYGLPPGENPALVSLHDAGGDSRLLLYFESGSSFVDWWADTFAGQVEEPSANLIAPSLSLESLVCILHAVDCYRRAYMESMLSYTAGRDLSIPAAQYMTTMRQSLQSGDTRWLLPALFALTPGLGGLALNLRHDHLDVVGELGFLDLFAGPGGGEDIFLFGEAGKIMGMEFYATWLSSVGWEATAAGPGGDMVTSRAFLAPTAFANHLFTFNPAGRSFGFSHQALTLSGLKSAMAGLLQPASAPGPVAEGTTPSPRGPLPGPGRERCDGCGEESPPGSKFCQGCGRPFVAAEQVPARSSCPSCGRKVDTGAWFCGGCGQTLKK